VKSPIFRIAGIVALLLVLAPFFSLLWHLPSCSRPETVFSSRQLVLLGKSVLYAGASALLVTFAGLGVAVGLSFRIRGRLTSLRWLPLLLLSLPPSIHYLGWSLFSDLFRVHGGGGSGQGWAAAVWIQTMAMLPLSTLFFLAGLHRIRPEILDAARVFSPENRIWERIILPALRPFFPGCMALVFLLSMAEYTVPALAGRTTWAMEIFSRFAATHEVAVALYLSFPVLLIGIPLLSVLMRRLPLIVESDHRGRRPEFLRPGGWPGLLGDAGLLVLFFHVAVPVVMLTHEALRADPLTTIVSRSPELLYSLKISAAAAFLVLLPGALLGTRPSSDRAISGWTILAVLPLMVPAPLIGIGWSTLVSGCCPAAAVAEQVLPVAVLSTRFAPISVLLFLAWSFRRDRRLSDAVRLFQSGALSSFRKIHLPLAMPVLVASTGLVLAFGLGELGATLMVLPPGKMTLAVYLYNALHYGATGSVATAALMLGGACGFSGAVVLLFLHDRRGR